MHIFIDTNIFLSFYHFTIDDLEELKKLIVLLEQERIVLYLPSQVVSEFTRNRDNKITDAIKKLREQKLNLQFPQVCKDYTEYSKLRSLQKEYESNHTTLINNLIADVKAHKLKADSVIEQLFKLSKIIECDREIVEKAKIRFELGNPPGKNGSLGDAVNWEALLFDVPNIDKFYFITEDKDYFSPLDEEEFNDYLFIEWSNKKKSELTVYKRLSNFFKENFPDIVLASELEKDILISDLLTTKSFSNTHLIISKLGKYAEFTSTQINALVAAATRNSQIRWILSDEDISGFYKNLIKDKDKLIEPNNLLRIKQALRLPLEEKQETDDDLPF